MYTEILEASSTPSPICPVTTATYESSHTISTTTATATTISQHYSTCATVHHTSSDSAAFTTTSVNSMTQPPKSLYVNVLTGNY